MRLHRPPLPGQFPPAITTDRALALDSIRHVATFGDIVEHDEVIGYLKRVRVIGGLGPRGPRCGGGVTT